ncbi:unnamed protein product [Phaeothamnion confervicola]
MTTKAFGAARLCRRQLWKVGKRRLTSTAGEDDQSRLTASMDAFYELEQRISAQIAGSVSPPLKPAIPREPASEEGLSAVKGHQERSTHPTTLAKPQEPDASACCGNGCSKCVWIMYWAELNAWEAIQKQVARREGRKQS